MDDKKRKRGNQETKKSISEILGKGRFCVINA